MKLTFCFAFAFALLLPFSCLQVLMGWAVGAYTSASFHQMVARSSGFDFRLLLSFAFESTFATSAPFAAQSKRGLTGIRTLGPGRLCSKTDVLTN
jgi:hypothetical protein